MEMTIFKRRLRSKMAWIAMCGWLVAAGAANAGAVETRTFNVVDYGAKGDDKTDNTEALSARTKP